MNTPSPIARALTAYTAVQKELNTHTPKRLSEYQSANEHNPDKIDYYTINVDMVNENENAKHLDFPASAHVRIATFTKTSGATRHTLTITVGEFTANVATTIPLDSPQRTVEDTIADVLDAYRMVVWRDEYDLNLRREEHAEELRARRDNEKKANEKGDE